MLYGTDPRAFDGAVFFVTVGSVLFIVNLVPAFRAYWFEQFVLLGGLLAVRLFLWWDFRESVRRCRIEEKTRRGTRQVRRSPAPAAPPRAG